MPLKAPPIDYAATRKQLVAAISMATGLPNGRIIREEAQGPIQPVPPKPYASFLYRIASMSSGFRDSITAAPEAGPTMYTYAGHRGIAVDLSFYGQTVEQAYGMAASMQSALFQEPVLDVLRAARLAVWQIGDVQDVSELLGTGFEGRALLEFQLWINVHQLVDLGVIESVDLVGEFVADDGAKLTTEFTVNANERV